MTHTIPETKMRARETAGRVADKARDALDTAKSAMHDKLDAVTDRTRRARDWASDRMDAARDLPYELADRGADIVRARPYVMLGVALAVGYLIGRMMAGDLRFDAREENEPY